MHQCRLLCGRCGAPIVCWRRNIKVVWGNAFAGIIVCTYVVLAKAIHMELELVHMYVIGGWNVGNIHAKILAIADQYGSVHFVCLLPRLY